MIVCMLCGHSMDVLECVAHADSHIRTLVQAPCKVSYDVIYDEHDPRIIIKYSLVESS